MFILDSNVWIHFAVVGGESESLVEAIVEGGQRSVINAYIQEEIRTNIDNDHSIDRDVRDQALSQFFGMVGRSSNIQTPESEAVERMDLEAEQAKTHNKLIGAFGDIQPKDAPVLTLAYRFLSYRPTIYTNDQEFARLSPEEHGVPEISIQHCDLKWARPERPAE